MKQNLWATIPAALQAFMKALIFKFICPGSGFQAF